MLEDWVNQQHTPKGIGIDCVCISTIRALDERLGGVLVQRTFTDQELTLAQQASDYWCFLAGRFAVKEAAFKALCEEQQNLFDFRRVETLRRKDGCPVITPSSIPQAVLKKAGGKRLLVSITGEDDYAIAVVQVI